MSTQESELTQLKAKALKAYAQKDYASSTELYASACELQSVLQGENNPRNAHLLYLYGRSLFEVALKKSDVLGGVAAQDEKKPKDEKKGKKATDMIEGASGAETVIGNKALEKGVKPGLFSFTGDENWDDSDGEEDAEKEGEGEGGEAGKGDEEEDDDFTLAWEILDYARVLFLKQLSPNASVGVTSDTPPAGPAATDIPTEPIVPVPSEGGVELKEPEPKEDKPEEKDVPKPDTTEPVVPCGDEAKALRTALADTYDLLGEVSLESESFAQAARDLRSSLDLKLELYPIESTLISEAHYKLSLALEFAAASEDVSENDRLKGREEAALEMEKAILSCRARIGKEEEAVAAATAADDDKGKGKERVTKSLTDAREMVEELETRLADLRTTSNEAAMDPLRGILGQVLGEDPATAKKRIEEAMSGARDLTGLVRKKQPAATTTPISTIPATTTPASTTPVSTPPASAIPVSTTPVAVGTAKPTENAGAKRKLDDLQEEEEVVEDSKKAKVSDGEEA